MKITRDNQKIDIITYLESKKKATIFQHFKGKKYNIVCLGKDSEDCKDVIIYRGLYEDNPVWVREYNDFFAKVDKEKYPDIEQTYRFEIIE